ncbi:hypothetical protein [Mycetocola spongiae]|uniref:hypothetical protein n=1 Tax=Mycetocola spongiae TaxID=2859226 RepID=UPI001CF3E5A5|nr:hypothetical protein [Mycetocola spongiae]UCR88289.1 hypothetical protein KXZ72_09900 [Mycetocola spongiae]
MTQRTPGTPPATGEAELSALVNDLRAENARLRAERERPPRPRTGRGRALAAGVLITIGALLAPVSILAHWAGQQLDNTDSFIATFEPLLRESAVQERIAAEVTVAISAAVDIPGLTEQAFDGLEGLGVPPRSAAALGALRGAATQGLHTMIERTVAGYLDSEQFTSLSSAVLSRTHAQITGTLRGDSGTLVNIGADGAVGIELAPVIAAVKTALIGQGFSVAAAIPELDRIIVIAQSEEILRAQPLYALAVGVGAWLPLLALLILGGGILLAPRRRAGLIWASGLLAGVLILTVVGLGIARGLVVPGLAQSLGSREVAELVYDALTRFTLSLATAIAVLAVAVAVSAWFSGPGSVAVRLRGLGSAVCRAARTLGEKFGLSTGAFGERVYRVRHALRALIGVAAGCAILLIRPLTPGLVIGTILGALLLLIIAEFIQRPPAEAGATTLA